MARRHLADSGLPERRSLKAALAELRRAVREALGRCKFGKGEAATTFARLGTSCVFCDAPATLWSLLFPVRSGGEMVLGNVVPSCGACEASKGEQEFAEWLMNPSSVPQRRGVRGLRDRVRRLREHLGHFGYVPKPLEDRLGVEGMRLFTEYLSRERALRRGIRQLVVVVGSSYVPPNNEMQRTKPAQAMVLRR